MHVPEMMPAEIGIDRLLAAELLGSLKKTLETGVLKSAAAATASVHPQPTDCSIASSCPLSGIQCSCHIGFYSNEQVICNLLHMAVQLSLFRPPTQSQHTEPPSDEEQRLLGWKTDAAQQQGEPVSEASCQTEPPARSKPEVFESKCVGVRIGGGYHLAMQEGPFRKRNQTGSRARSSSAGPAVARQEVAFETAVHTGFGDHPFAHGAAPEAMPASRYSVGSYDPSEGWHTPKAPESNQSACQAGHLYRVLKPVQHRHEIEPPLSESQPISTSILLDGKLVTPSQDLHFEKVASPAASTREGDTPPSPRSQASCECSLVRTLSQGSQASSECHSASDDHCQRMAWRSPEELASAWYPESALPSSATLSVTMSPGRPRPRLPTGKRRPSSAGAIRRSESGPLRSRSIEGNSKKEVNCTPRIGHRVSQVR